MESHVTVTAPVPCFVAHVSEDGSRQELVRTHLLEVARMASDFARPFHAESWAYAAGLLHDIGKYSKEFQNRILHGGPKVDHSTAGSAVLFDRWPLLSYCVAGHHGGLPDGGVSASWDSSLYGRINKAHDDGIPRFEAWKSEIEMPEIKAPELEFPPKNDEATRYACAFLTRMVFSCLVDADFLCTERFMCGVERKGLASDSVNSLLEKLERHISKFYPPISPLNTTRCGFLNECKEMAVHPRGVFSITAPTGSGKTYGLMRFALNHAVAPGNGQRRIIVAEPYTSIIEQNADVYREVFGQENVLEHHANFDFDAMGDDGVGNRLRLAAENWEAPIIVTTNVQFFESLYSNRTSRCRKLHNIAGSVIVLDEAQMIPTEYLLPCVSALAELVRNYGCSVVLCSATQPALNGFFEREGLSVTEVVGDVPGLFQAFSRVTYQSLGSLDDDSLAERMLADGSALCIVNSRKQALHLFDLLHARGEEGLYHLTTLMHPVHRRRVLEEIRHRMKIEGLPCLVVATSLVEAGVDLDFPVVYRALAGLDSMVQAGGRCNREGKQPAKDSFVYLFEAADVNPNSIPPEVRQRADVTRSVVPGVTDSGSSVDLGAPDVVRSFFDRLYFYKGDSELDKGGIRERLCNYPIDHGKPSIDFKTVSDSFHLIEGGAYSIVVPDDEVLSAIERVKEGVAARGDLRRLSTHSVSVYEYDLRELWRAGAVEELAHGLFLLVDEARYKEQTGLDTSVFGGEGLYW